MRVMTVALAMACVLLAGHGPWRATQAAAAPNHSGSRQAVQTYLQGVSNVLQAFAGANTNIVSAGDDLTNDDFQAATLALSKAVTGEQRAKQRLDALSVPSRATRVHQVLERALSTFIAGTRMMRNGASHRSRSAFESGLKKYIQGAPILAQAYPLIAQLGK